MCQVLVSALCMYYISSYNLMGQGVSPFYRRGKCLTGTSPVVGSRRQDGESCQRGWWLVFAGLRSFIGIYFEPLQTVLAWPFFLGHRGWAGVWSGPDGEQHSTAFDPGIHDPWLLRGSQDLESCLCLLCPVPLGRQRAVLAHFVLPVAVFWEHDQGTQPRQTQGHCFFFKHFLMPPRHLEVKLFANKAYPSK